MGLLNNDIVQVSWRGLCFGQRIILTQHYLVAGDWGVGTTVAADLATIVNVVAPAGAFDNTTAYLACLPATYQLTEIRAQRIRAIRSAYVSQVMAFPGTHASPATVANDAAALTMRTAFAGRQYLGTKHIGPIPDAASVAGLLTAAYKGLLGALGTRLLVSFTPAGAGSILVPIIFHRATNTNTVTTNFIIGDQSRVQRRRTVGVGE